MGWGSHTGAGPPLPTPGAPTVGTTTPDKTFKGGLNLQFASPPLRFKGGLYRQSRQSPLRPSSPPERIGED